MRNFSSPFSILEQGDVDYNYVYSCQGGSKVWFNQSKWCHNACQSTTLKKKYRKRDRPYSEEVKLNLYRFSKELQGMCTESKYC